MPTLKQLALSPPNSRKLLKKIAFHQILFLTWMRKGCTGKSYRQKLISRGKKNRCLASRHQGPTYSVPWRERIRKSEIKGITGASLRNAQGKI